MGEKKREAWDMTDVRFVQLIAAPYPGTGKQTLMALDACGDVWVYDDAGNGWDLWEKFSATYADDDDGSTT